MARKVTKWECEDGMMFDSESAADEYEYKDRIIRGVNDLMKYVDRTDGIETSWKGVRDFICNHSVALSEIFNNKYHR